MLSRGVPEPALLFVEQGRALIFVITSRLSFIETRFISGPDTNLFPDLPGKDYLFLCPDLGDSYGRTSRHFQVGTPALASSSAKS